MQLITKAVAAKLYRADQAFLASEDGETPDEIAVKFFTPWGAATWWVARGTPLDQINGEPCEPENAKDWHLWGYVTLGLGPGCDEFGYTLLSQLQELRGPFGLRVERDRNYTGKLSEVMQ